VGSELGVRALLVYMAIYLFTNVGAFAVLIAMRRNGQSLEKVEDLAGLGRTDPAMALAMTLFMFSMAGIPPLAGFFGKYFVIGAAIQGGFVTLAVVGVLSSAVSAYYYLRVIKVMYFDAGIGALDARPASLSVVLAGTGLFTLFFFAFPGLFLSAAQAAVAALVG
jgi:NADH-quinone oxidoreductase subunit N